VPQCEDVEGEDALSRLVEDLQKDRPFFLFRERFNNLAIHIPAAIVSAHLEAYMKLPHYLVQRMLADFNPPPSRTLSRNIGDASYFFGVLGLISNKQLDAQRMDQFLDLVMVERITPKAFLKQVFSIHTLTIDAIAEALLDHCVRSNNPTALDFLLGAGLPGDCLQGPRGWQLFRQTFEEKSLDLATARQLLSLCWPDPDKFHGRTLFDSNPGFDGINGIAITQDGDFMDSLLGMRALSLSTALSQAVRWNQPGRVSMFLESGAVVADCRVRVRTPVDSFRLKGMSISALDHAYLNGFQETFQLLSQAGQARNTDFFWILSAASIGIAKLGEYLQNNEACARADVLLTALDLAVLFHREQLNTAIDTLLRYNNIANGVYWKSCELSLAIAIPKIGLVKRLLLAGADINKIDVVKSACSHVSNLDCLRLLVAQGMDLQAFGAIGLFVALEADNQSAVKYLLQAGADINGQLSLSGSVINWIPLLSVAARRGNHEMARAILMRGADVNVVNDNYGDETGWRPIHYAARFGDLEMVKLLVEHGADLQDDKDFCTLSYTKSVMECCSLRTVEAVFEERTKKWTNEDTRVFKFLADQEAPLNSEYVRRGGSETLVRDSTITCLIKSMADNDLIRFALQRGARFDGRRDPDTENRSITAVETAAAMGNLVIARELWAKGADIARLGSDILGRGPDADPWKRIVAAKSLANGRGAFTNAAGGFQSCITPCEAIKEGSHMLVPFLLNSSSDGEFIFEKLDEAVLSGKLDMVCVMLTAAKSQGILEKLRFDRFEYQANRFGHWVVGRLLRESALSGDGGG